jgi:hypothetical protein
VVVDSSYRELMRVKAQKGLAADLHEFIIGSDGIAYFTAYRPYAADLRSVDGPAKGKALDATIQGVDLSDGALVFDWHSMDHIDFAESYESFSKKAPFDPVHLNSIDILPDGTLLVSARNTWTVYKIDLTSGEIVWRLGGKKSDFTLGSGARFAWQHDARLRADGTISLFDDQGDPPEAKQSRGLVLAVDESAKTAAVRQEYRHPGRGLLAGSQGSFQTLSNGNVLVGWGAEPFYTEYEADGTLVLDGQLATGTSYRALRFSWAGTPIAAPAIAAERSATGNATVFASWNGSTETERWRLLVGSAPGTLRPVAEVRRAGFETAMTFRGAESNVAVAALDANGRVLAQSPTINV